MASVQKPAEGVAKLAAGERQKAMGLLAKASRAEPSAELPAKLLLASCQAWRPALSDVSAISFCCRRTNCCAELAEALGIRGCILILLRRQIAQSSASA